MDFGGRKELFRALVGSHNYNLNTAESDRDYKVFVIPTFNDLYSGEKFSKSYVSDTEDYDVHDVRKVSDLWWKSNINFAEILYSEEIIINKNLSRGTKKLVQDIFNMKDRIVTMNLPYLYNACIGMHKNKMSTLEKGTEGTMHLIEQFGWDTKQGLHAYRVLDFLDRFSDNNFTDFKRAIWYCDGSIGKETLLEIKNGIYSIGEYRLMVNNKLIFVECACGPLYKTRKANEETNSELVEIIKEIIRREM